jgi:CubicO group peptidase (beta-lactamase class C family)
VSGYYLVNQSLGSALKNRHFVILSFSFILSAQFASAEQPTDEVARFVRAEMEQQHIPGLALLVSRNGRPIRTECYGLSNVLAEAKPEQIADGVAEIYLSRTPHNP